MTKIAPYSFLKVGQVLMSVLVSLSVGTPFALASDGPPPTSLIGGPTLYVDNNTRYPIHVEMIWTHRESGYWYGGSSGSTQGFDIGARNRTWSATARNRCYRDLGERSKAWSVGMPCYWGHTQSKGYNEGQRLAVKSNQWTKAVNGGEFTIDVTKLKNSILELDPDCKQDLCPVIEWSVKWNGDGWKITLNEGET